MMADIKSAAVIGAGVMGAGIAAQIANAGVPVVLLDIVPDGSQNRSAIAQGAIAKMLKTNPAPFMSQKASKLITPGNTEDDFDKLAACDWIIEVVVEKLEVKQALYRRIEALMKPETIVASNTSTLPLAKLCDGMSETFKRNFLITHFFNPPRYMRLLEIITGPATDPKIVETVTRFADLSLGKTPVICRDTPGFIANRIGAYWLQLSIIEAIDAGLTVEEADAIAGRSMGFPKTGVFGLLDLIGLDLMPHIDASLKSALPNSDAYHATSRDLPFLKKMVAEGYTGRKGKGGFYRLDRENNKQKQALDFASGTYRVQQKADLPELKEAGKDLAALLKAPGKAGQFASRMLVQTLGYAASLVPEIADTIADVDAVMRLGYNWKWGPFELIDKIGVEQFKAQLTALGLPIPPLVEALGTSSFYRIENGVRHYFGTDGAYHPIVRPEGVLLLADIKLKSEPLLKNASAALWDLGDGVACFELTGKMGTFDDQVFALLGSAISLVAKDFKGLVIGSDNEHFSAGANLGLALFAANIAAWNQIETLVAIGQQMLKALKYAPFPAVAAPAGLALGGGCEIVLHADAIQAHAETYIGLVECGVGLIPGWGGCGEMINRWAQNPNMPKGPMPAVAKVFETISMASVSKSAAEAKEQLFLRPGDRISMNRDRLLYDAKQRVLELAESYTPPQPANFNLPGPSGRLGMNMAVENLRRQGIAFDHDLVVADELAGILSGGTADLVDTVNEPQMLALERQAFLRLIKKAPSLARIEHMLETGKPLRN